MIESTLPIAFSGVLIIQLYKVQ
eukprot:COSAG01_NODE_54663_length_330_cov_1.432900_1_plen_22_part_10